MPFKNEAFIMIKSNSRVYLKIILSMFILVIGVYLLLKVTTDEQFGVDGCHRDNVTIVLLYPPGAYYLNYMILFSE